MRSDLEEVLEDKFDMKSEEWTRGLDIKDCMLKKSVTDVVPEGNKRPGDRFKNTNTPVTANGCKGWAFRRGAYLVRVFQTTSLPLLKWLEEMWFLPFNLEHANNSREVTNTRVYPDFKFKLDKSRTKTFQHA
ncbi:hypothetical protein CB1_001466002 [Camelus ferus]|nr:hypothetical protein CB1_016133001 [Camelus ferus]EPY76227.1 hypothetical protein CB1_001466002 [Camelus ferus]